MGTGIRLHSERGLNPAMVYCWVCGNDVNEIALLGAMKIYECKCGMKHFGRPKSRKCVKCAEDLPYRGRDIEHGEKLPGGPCERCEELLKRTSLLICGQCKKIFDVDAHRVLKPFNPDEMSLEEALAKEYVEKMVGQVTHQTCEECTHENGAAGN